MQIGVAHMSSIPLEKYKTYRIVDDDGEPIASIVLGRQNAATLAEEIIKHTELTICDKYGNPKTYFMSIEQHRWFRGKWDKELTQASDMYANIVSELNRVSRLLDLFGYKSRDRGEKARVGFVYVLKQVNGTHYKIGRTSSPNDRMRTFKLKLPFPVEFKILIKCDDMYALERDFHKHFASKRVSGEWFTLDKEDLKYIRSFVS